MKNIRADIRISVDILWSKRYELLTGTPYSIKHRIQKTIDGTWHYSARGPWWKGIIDRGKLWNFLWSNGFIEVGR